MKRSLNYGLISVGAIFDIFPALITLVAATLKPNDHKPLIVKLVQGKKPHSLKLEGGMR